jgi:DNA-binding NtrC family response regulator
MDVFLRGMGKTVEKLPTPATCDGEIILRNVAGERMPTIVEAENTLVAQAMRMAKGNQGIAAGYLGINRSALNKKLLKRKNG